MSAAKKYRLLDDTGNGRRDIVRLNENDREEKIGEFNSHTKTILLLDRSMFKWRTQISYLMGAEREAWEHWGLLDGPPVEKPAGNAPKKPALSRKEGDKTPAYVEWLQKWFPEDFRLRYGVISYATQSVPVVDAAGNKVYDRLTGLPKMDVRPHTLISHRKTHLTSCPNGTEVWDEGQDIDFGGES